MALPSQARVVIIGGGIVGCSVAYHLTKLGWKDVVLLERKKLTSGTTWHAAGIVVDSLANANLTRLAKHSVKLYRSLEAETGQATGFVQPGSVSVATTRERWEEMLRRVALQRTLDVVADVITPAEAKQKWPLLNVDDVIGAVWYPNDGKCNPTDVSMALVRGARAGGARIFEDTKVTRILTESGHVKGVETDQGTIACEYVVNCGGMWARSIGEQVGVDVPLQACEHFYIVTEPMEGVTSDLPMMRDPERGIYFKEDTGKLLFGAFEHRAKPWAIDGIPEDFCFDELPEDFDHFAPYMEGALHRVPSLQTVGIRKFFNGPESFTADHKPVMGEAPNLKNFYVAAGFNSSGIQWGGGAGWALAQWIVDGEPPFDLWDVDIRRLFPFQNKKSFLVPRVEETLGLIFQMHWPNRQFETSRGIKRSPFYNKEQELGACFGEVAGYERPSWYAPKGVEPVDEYSYGRQNWFEYCREECQSVRNNVGFFDQSVLAKFMVTGKDAERELQRLSCADVGRTGRATYTQWLNPKGRIEADLTVTKLADDRFLVVTALATSVRDAHYFKNHIAPGADAAIEDISNRYAVIGLMGPNSRKVLSKLTSVDLSNDQFPFGAAKEIDFGWATALALRISYVGELGWEIYLPNEFAPGALELLLEVGKDFGLRPAGMNALNYLRLEKAYRHWGHDIGPDETPAEAGLSFLCAMDKAIPFIGRDAVASEKGKRLSKRLVQFALQDPEPLIYHNEPIFMNGANVGHITSAGYSFSLNCAIGMGYVHYGDGVDQSLIEGAKFEIQVADKKVPANASLRAFYDPKGERLKM